MTTTTGHKHPVDARLAAVDGFVYRNRHIFAPVGVGLLLATAGWGLHVAGWPWVAWALAGWWWLISWNITLDQPTLREKWYAFACSTSCALWVSLVAWLGLGVVLASVGAVLLLAFGAPWAVHRRVKRGVEVDRQIEAWGDGTAVGLPGTSARGTTAGDGWYSFKIKANEPGRYTLAAYKQARSRIAARFGVRSEAVSFAASEHEGEVEVTVRDKPRDTHHAEPSTDTVSIVGPEQVGTSDNGDPIEVAPYLDGHGACMSVAVGVTGSGKSCWINDLAERTVRAPDAILCMVDLSPGAQELKAWAPACYKFAQTVAEAEELFEWLGAVCTDRGSRSEGRLFVPDEQHPAIVVLVDEAATLFAPDLLPADAEVGDRKMAQRVADTRAQKVEQGIRVYRKYGVGLHLSTQYGDVRALGGSTIQQQLISGYTAVFRTAKNTDAHRVAPASRGIEPAELPANKPGTLYLSGVTVDGTLQGRLRYLGDSQITDTVDYWAPRQGDPEPELQALPGGSRTIPRPTGTAGTGGETAGHDQSPGGDSARVDGAENESDDGAIVPNFTAGQSRPQRSRLSPDESRQLVLDTLRGFPDGATVAEVAGECGRSERMVRARLGELQTAGLATSKGRREPRWRAN